MTGHDEERRRSDARRQDDAERQEGTRLGDAEVVRSHGSPTSDDRAPGEDDEYGPGSVARGIRGYAVGLGLAALLTIASFWAAGTDLIYGPGIPVALIALAVAQMGVHLVFFLHVTTGPDNSNNVLALAFGVLIVALVLIGSIWIMSHLHHNLMPMGEMMMQQR